MWPLDLLTILSRAYLFLSPSFIVAIPGDKLLVETSNGPWQWTTAGSWPKYSDTCRVSCLWTCSWVWRKILSTTSSLSHGQPFAFRKPKLQSTSWPGIGESESLRHTSVAECFVLWTLGPGLGPQCPKLVNTINWLAHINMNRIAHITVPAFSRLKLRQEDFVEFKDSWGYRITPLSKKEKQKVWTQY